MGNEVETVVDLYRTVHRLLRELVTGMDRDGLNWSPGPDANSIAVLVTHTVASELDTLTFVRNVPNERDRDAEFEVQDATADDLVSLLDLADSNLTAHGNELGANELDALRDRPGREPQLGRHWLINNYGHAREHLGHAQLTKLLYEHRGA